MEADTEPRVVIIGAGPAGLTAAYELTKLDVRPLVVEQRDKVGGLSRTEVYKGYHFDMGGHRFFTKVEEVRSIWHTLLGDEFLRRPRLSRILYDGKFYQYPIRLPDTLHGLGFQESILVLGSYLRWQLFPYPAEETYEQWVTNRFGRRLFQAFFKTYTEKVWGVSCADLKSEWAAQRIKDLSFRTAVLSAIRRPRAPIKTLINEFEYPRLGPGMMWTAVQDEILRKRATVQLNSEVVRINRTGNRIESVVIASGGMEQVLRGEAFISSMPVTELVMKMHPPEPRVSAAARQLNYRDFLTVGLIINQPELFPDNWIYVHSPNVRVGRIQNFKNWSPSTVPDQTKTSLGLEYFCTEGDEIWSMSDEKLIALATREIERIGLARSVDVEDGCVFRVSKAYPIYDSGYSTHLDVVKEFVDGFHNLQTIGRNGLHRYNNQDHSMLTGMLAVRNLMLGETHDLWNVNVDQEYHEELRGGQASMVTDHDHLKEAASRQHEARRTIASDPSTRILAEVFAMLTRGVSVRDRTPGSDTEGATAAYTRQRPE